MKPLLRCCSALFVLLLVLSLAGCKDKEMQLVGTYSTNDNGQMRVYLRIEKKGDSYFMTGNHGGKWGTAVEVNPVTRETFAQVIKAPILVDFAGLGNNNVAIFQVPKGWRLGKFQSKTGFILATVIGPIELYKN